VIYSVKIQHMYARARRDVCCVLTERNACYYIATDNGMTPI
jgi:hypothetical protein